MIAIADILRPAHLDLDLARINAQEAVLKLATFLKNDERVVDWNVFYEGLAVRNPCVAVGPGFELCIPHSRTNAVSSMVMSAGRSKNGIRFPGSKHAMHYIFVIGVPVALASDYLRIIGALARIFKDKDAESNLRAAEDPAEFLALLTAAELKM